MGEATHSCASEGRIAGCCTAHQGLSRASPREIDAELEVSRSLVRRGRLHEIARWTPRVVGFHSW